MDNPTTRRWLIIAAFLTGCSQGDTAGTAGPSANLATLASNGSVRGSADGDVKTGGGALEIIRLRMDRQTLAGTSILRQYALPGVTYFMNPGEVIELWPEWDPNLNLVPAIIPANPRLTVDWGEPGSTQDINCGACKLTHYYPNPGVYRVIVTLDDRNGTRVSRTFFLNSLAPPPSCVAPTSVNIPNQCVLGITFNAGPFFAGSNLVFSLEELSCQVSSEVSAMGGLSGLSINPTTGLITSTGGSGCVEVTATNSCGSSSQSFFFDPLCD